MDKSVEKKQRINPQRLVEAFGLCIGVDREIANNPHPALLRGTAEISILPAFGLNQQIGSTASHGIFDKDSDYQVRSLSDGRMAMLWDDGFVLLVAQDGKSVEYSAEDERSCEHLYPYVIDFSVSAALLLQGEETLHGTVLEFESRTVGLIGPSCVGKSTLAAFLVSRGAELVTDDIMRLVFGPEGTLVFRGPDHLKLFRDARGTYLPDAPSYGLFHPNSDKELIRVVRAASRRKTSRLDLLVYLDCQQEASSRVGFEEVAKLDKFQLLAPSTMDTRFNRKGRYERHFAFVTEVARKLPLYRLTYVRSAENVLTMARLIEELASQENH